MRNGKSNSFHEDARSWVAFNYFFHHLKLLLNCCLFFNFKFFSKAAISLRMASASSWVKFPRSCLALFGEGSMLEHGKATIRDFEKGKGTGEIRLGEGARQIV
jgi:hypothetical protein